MVKQLGIRIDHHRDDERECPAHFGTGATVANQLTRPKQHPMGIADRDLGAPASFLRSDVPLD
jgi:hypothetical protein